MWRKYWQWIFVSCLSPPPPRLAMSVYSDCLDVHNKTSAQKEKMAKFVNELLLKFPSAMNVKETYYTNPPTHSCGTNLILGPIFFLPKPISFFCLFSHYEREPISPPLPRKQWWAGEVVNCHPHSSLPHLRLELLFLFVFSCSISF